MGTKTLETKNGTVIVDESFDENDFDPDSMLPEQEVTKESGRAENVSVTIGNDTYTGILKTYSVFENKKTGRKTVKIIIQT